MAYLIGKHTIHHYTSRFQGRPRHELPEYFVFSTDEHGHARFESLNDWLHRQVIHNNPHLIPTLSPENGSNTGLG